MKTTQSTLQQIRVFISSPSDVADARVEARKAVSRVNRLVARHLGFFLEATGWEDLPTGKATRAQERINPVLQRADIYIGIFNKRYGTPTGQAESGSEEEYELICNRCNDEDPPPEVKLYFKKLSSNDLDDPGPQLRKVLDFKKRVSATDLYHEFISADALGARIEDELADYVHSKAGLETSSSKVGIGDQREAAIRLLARMIEIHGPGDSFSLDDLADDDEINTEARELEERGLIRRLGDRFCLAASIDGFLAIAKLMFESNRQRSLLESIFYSEMLQMSVSGIAMSRFHCGLDENQATVIRSLALVSQSAAEFLLFGDTELHDNLHIHAKRIGQTGLADDQLFQDLIHRMVLRYLSDDERNLLLGRIDGRQIEAQVFRIRIAAAHANGLEFAVETLKPVVRLKASEQIRKGQMISGSPGLPIHVGTLMVHLQEYDFAQAEFDQILLNDDATDEDRFAALNNKGLVLLEVGKPDEAAQLFKNAIDLAPERTEPRKNLELAERAAKGKLTSC